MKLRVTTFNCENLFNRYAILDQPWENRSYEKMVEVVGLVSIASRAGDLASYATSDLQRNNTAQAILDCEPDILAVQEVENMYTLRVFNETFLDDYFDRMILIDGNDSRGIDVGFLMKTGLEAEVVGIRTHIDDAEQGKTIRRTAFLDKGYRVSGAIFSRDCLEVDVKFGGKVLTFLLNHFKAQDRTKASVVKRTAQAERVAELAKQAVAASKLPVVLGDLNADGKTDKSLDALKSSPVLADPFKSIPAKDLWTHYFTFGKSVSRLDWILPHKSLSVSSPTILRNGLTMKAKQFYDGPRYPTIGLEGTEASDHCPTSVVIEI